MNETDAEVFYQTIEFINKLGQWFTLCEFLSDKGIKPDEIANAINRASLAASRYGNLTGEDCVP